MINFWFLKYLTALLGYYLFGGSFLGALLGYFVGRFIGNRLSYGANGGFGRFGGAGGFANVTGGRASQKNKRQALFFKTVFTLMGKLAKADGRVGEAEIAHVEGFMQQLGMNPESRKLAISFFKTGSAPDFQISPLIEEFNQATSTSRSLRQMLLIYLLQVAMADGTLHPNELQLLRNITVELGFPEQSFDQLLSMLRAQSQFTGGYYQGGGSQSSGYTGTTPSQNELATAYQALGVSEDMSDADIKTAYRRLVREFHPDKLMGQGLPEEMIKEATERVKEIHAAYDLIKENRGMK